ncbi:MAG: TetR/AcrR family transcriptional regulator, partial [Bacteroidales bacterium]|nr:TetR/AcrR family transcriptional regulator [Bacteroidales bacterium]
MKERIIEEASKLFGRTGIKSTTMDDIARHLGISKRTIYENFKDKEALLTACINSLHVENMSFCEKIFLKAGNVAEAILVLLQKGSEQASQWQFNMLNDIRKYYPQVYKNSLLGVRADKQKKMEELVQRGMDEGVFRDSLNPQIIAYFFCSHDEIATLNNKGMDKFSITE